MQSITKDEPPTAEPPHRFTSKLLLAIRPQGVAVHTHPIAKPLPVGLAELALMSALDQAEGVDVPAVQRALGSVAATYGADGGQLLGFLDRLKRMGAFVPTTSASPRVATRPAPKEAGESAPGRLDPSALMVLHTTFVLRLGGGRYEFVGHEGAVRFDLGPVEVATLAALGAPTTRGAALERQRALLGEHALGEAAFDALLAELHAHGVLSNTPFSVEFLKRPFKPDRFEELSQHFLPHARAADEAEREREQRTGRTRVRVVPVAFDQGAPLGVGLCMAYAMHHDGGRLQDHYHFRYDWVWAPDRFDLYTKRPGVYLFSNYLWSHGKNAAISARVKEASPRSVTIHGGPDTPRYERDLERYFADHPHVDVTVHGEGELATAEILDRLVSAFEGDAPLDLSVLADVPGISYRMGESIVHTGARERIKDLNDIPSPILTGMFECYRGLPDLLISLESNRGCPYGCTFCDWGAATLQKIRQYDLERFFAELQWCADVGAAAISLADANFGIFPRDVQIAEEVARLTREKGSPRAFSCSYAKNSVKHTKPIISTLSRAGILAQGVIAIQSSDPATLEAVHRSNIKTEKYDQLALEMKEAGLPLVVELMLGLPGSSVESFKADLQQCIERELPVRINTTTVLINSPMNAPAYRAQYGIETDKPHEPGQMPLLVATNTFTREDHVKMQRLRRLFLVLEHFAILRFVARFVRQELGMREIDLFERLMVTAPGRPEYPLLTVLVNSGWGLMAPPLSWHLVMDEVRHFLIHELGMQESTALDTILDVQASLLPAPDRAFPSRRAYPHDVVAWHDAILEAKKAGPEVDWVPHTRRLGELGPGELVVDDPGHVGRLQLGVEVEKSSVGAHWELDSPLARRMLLSARVSLDDEELQIAI